MLFLKETKVEKKMIENHFDLITSTLRKQANMADIFGFLFIFELVEFEVKTIKNESYKLKIWSKNPLYFRTIKIQLP